ncbi:MAG: UpxY family transcription antiterminator [candidate division KSB1 bacterium]|nr:UpxY family transcription antiterminator [candidate division KSB1 bacterium]
MLIDNNSDRYWYAFYTRPNHEKRVDAQLRDKRIESYLPLRTITRRWSDRWKEIQEPLFRCYVFVHADERERITALETYGVVRMIWFNGKPAIVRDEEIAMIRRILRELPAVEACVPVNVGDYVEIVRGPLAGIDGRLIMMKGTRRLVVTIDSIAQGVHFDIDIADVKPITEEKKVVAGESKVARRFREL